MWFGHSKWTKNTLCLFGKVCVCKWQGLITALIRPSLHSTHNHTLTRLLAVVSQCLCYAGLLFRKHCNTQQRCALSHTASVTTAAWLRMIYLEYLRYFSWTAHTGSFVLYLRQAHNRLHLYCQRAALTLAHTELYLLYMPVSVTSALNDFCKVTFSNESAIKPCSPTSTHT